MTYNDLKIRMAGFSSNRENLDNINLLLTKVNISILQVARDCVPLKLVRDSSSNRKMLRRIDNKAFVCIPLEIKDDSYDIDLDDDLIDALALHTIAGIETARAPAYMRMYWNIIDQHENAIMNDDLATNYTELQDLATNNPGINVDRDEYDKFLNGEIADINYKEIGGFNG